MLHIETERDLNQMNAAYCEVIEDLGNMKYAVKEKEMECKDFKVEWECEMQSLKKEIGDKDRLHRGKEENEKK